MNDEKELFGYNDGINRKQNITEELSVLQEKRNKKN